MKTKIFSLIVVGIFLISSMPICAQRYICLKNDLDAVAVSSDSLHLKLYKNSTLEVADSLKVRIDEISGNSMNCAGGLKKGAVFDVTKDNVDLSKVHYNDSARKDRSNVSGVTISVNFLTKVDGIEYLIPRSDAIEVDFLESREIALYKTAFEYNKSNHSLVIKSEDLPDGAKLVKNKDNLISNIKNRESIEEVPEDAKFRLIVSSEDDKYYLDELFKISDLKEIATSDTVNLEKDDTSRYLYIGGVIVLLLICLVYYFLRPKKKKDNNNEWNEDVFDDYDQSGSKSSDKKKKKKENDNRSFELSGDATPDLEHVIRQFESIRSSLNQMSPTLDLISAKISNGKDVERLKAEIKQKDSIITQRDGAIKNKDVIIKQKEVKIEQYIQQINRLNEETDTLHRQLEEANKLDKGTLVISDGQSFAQKANGLLTVCRKGEEIIKQYLMMLPEDDNLKMSYFLIKYIKEMPSKVRDQWNGVLSTLSIKGFINDLEITRYLQSESDQIDWLKKHFIEDLLQSYISPLVIMLDQIRCSKQYGLLTSAPSNVGKAVEEIIEECRKMGITVKYKPLFETITSDDKEQLIGEIRSDLPKEIEGFVSVQKNVPLYFEHIGVVAEGVRDDKTVCIAKL